MWFRTIFRRRAARPPEPGDQGERPRLWRVGARPGPRPGERLFDEAFLRRMERMSLQAQRTLRGNPSSGEHPSRRRLPATIFSDHRPYTSGDDLRYVDWNAYARQDHVLVKLGEAEQDVHVHLLVDASRSMTVGAPPRLRLAQQIAGALGYLALAHSDRLQVVPFGPTALRSFGPAQGKAHTLELLRYVERIAPQPDTRLAAVVQQHALRNPQGGIMVICSDLLASDSLDEALRAVAPPRWQTVVLHLLDQRDLRPELQGPLELEDSETGQRLALTLDEETLTAYRRSAAAWREGLGRICARRGATYAPVMSHWPLERQVVPYLRVRRVLT
ncbi:MAG TPA: DUF58 domain-containing protein [Chloroflexaceae bacterium]|nr:DUF58 domain-containing protein [Chloroflexaceae bacterium]